LRNDKISKYENNQAKVHNSKLSQNFQILLLCAVLAFVSASPVPEAKPEPQVLLTTTTINGVPTTTTTINGVPTALRYINPGFYPSLYTAPLIYTQPLTVVQTPTEVVQANL
jgi:hypothetical protein